MASTFSTIYLTQPVLPVLREEFGIDAAKASLTVSAVIFGIALATLPFGRLADRFPARPIILVGGTLASLCGFLCAATTSFPLLVAARFLQGVKPFTDIRDFAARIEEALRPKERDL